MVSAFRGWSIIARILWKAYLIYVGGEYENISGNIARTNKRVIGLGHCASSATFQVP